LPELETKSEATPTSKSKSKIDPLLECLVFLTTHYGRAKSSQALVSGLAYAEDRMKPSLFCEAAQRINLKTKIVKRMNIHKIPSAVLPTVLVLNNAQACVLLKINQNEETAVIWSPETGSERSVSFKDLKSSYSGFAIYIHPKAEFEEKALNKNDDYKDHWFWGPMLECKSIYLRVAVAAIFINIFALTSPIFIMNIYNRVIPNNAIETILF